MIRRGWAGACPATRHDGVQVGRTSGRTVQIDTGAADKTRYCYAAFTFDGHETTPRRLTAASRTPATALRWGRSPA